MNAALWSEIVQAAKASSGQVMSVRTPSFQPVPGGCVHESWRVDDSSGSWFVKTNAGEFLPVFKAELEGLEALGAFETLRVPRPVAAGICSGRAWLVMEFIPLRSGPSSEFFEMGRQLARLHRFSDPDGLHGARTHNYIGATRQRNTRHSNWATFFREERLAPQLDLHPGDFPGHAALLDAVTLLLADHQPAPSPLHGDLWGGNAAFDPGGRPVVYDPAFYFGDRETDIAFTRMFGGFPDAFHEGYKSEHPLPDDQAGREDIYNLYHLLNHHHLFGGAYGCQARSVMQSILHRTDSIFG